MEPAEYIDNFYLQLPNSVAIIGSSKSGKTTLLSRILDNLPFVTCECPPVSKMVICYGHYQPVYNKMIASVKKFYPNVEVEMHNGYPEEQFLSRDFWKIPNGSQMIIIMDDISDEIKPSFEKMLRGTLHHNSASLFYLSQDHSSEPKVVKNALRNVAYYFLTKSAHSGILLSDLNRKTHLYCPKFLFSAYSKVMERKKKDDIYPYLLIDLTVDGDTKNSVRTGIFDGEAAFIFRPV